jgi:hypothetical protein
LIPRHRACAFAASLLGRDSRIRFFFSVLTLFQYQRRSNMNFSKLRCTALASSLALVGAQTVHADTLSGTFAKDNDIQFFTFTLSSATTATLATTSFVGGGFVPWLYLWDSTGTFVQAATIAGSSDSTISEALAADTYFGAVVVSNNSFSGLDFPGAPAPFASVYDPSQFSHNGYLDTDDQFLLNQLNPSCAPGVTGYFVYDITGCENRTGNWALDITAAASTALSGVSPYPTASNVPEPGTLALALAGLAGFAPAARRRNV